MELKGIRRILDIYENKTKNMEEQTKLLNQVYMKYYNQYGENDTDDVQISVILDRIDELQSEIENLNT
jgi:hypothetical protein